MGEAEQSPADASRSAHFEPEVTLTEGTTKSDPGSKGVPSVTLSLIDKMRVESWVDSDAHPGSEVRRSGGVIGG
jgi:hypothetical protein